MNNKIVFNIIGKILFVEALLFIFPLIISLIYVDGDYEIWLLSIFTTAIFSFLFQRIEIENKKVGPKEGLVITSLSWLLFSVFGALPFLWTNSVPTYIDAFFETVSGFTTTGATIIKNVEVLSHSVLFWRSFTQFIGGMGVLIFAMAILPKISNQSIYLLKAEAPGPKASKLVSKMGDSAKILYLIYSVMTIVMVMFLLLGGMPLFDSLLTAFGTAGTGGFGIKNFNIAYYNSFYIDIVIGVFAILFGINFNVYFLLILKEFKLVFLNEELKTYFIIILISIIAVAISIMPQYSNIIKAWIDAFFQVGSIITTTAYTTVNYDLWPVFAKTILFILMFIGASAGSTGGGFKVSRIVILFKAAKQMFAEIVDQDRVFPLKIEGKKISDKLVRYTSLYLFIYMVIFLLSVLIILLSGFDIISSVSVVLAMLNNIGTGFSTFGPLTNYFDLGSHLKLIFSGMMFLGRLEIIPILILFMPRTWKKL